MIVRPVAHGVVDEYADLEIGLHRRDAVTWNVELRFSLPRTDAETQLDVVRAARWPTSTLDELDDIDDEEEYGLALGAGLVRARASGPRSRPRSRPRRARACRLRVRLVMGSSAAALHGLRWETLRNPVDGSTMLDERERAVLALPEQPGLATGRRPPTWRT